ncbi:hypothetical protein GP475_04105 [Corynebacterium poyangense]|uniref:Uncharacterized protein n=1 Tax=Corynebacterium poyangense TaxID=2684405 RepID=A0A7H0SMZ4_9CORY|nr:DUF5808 domain-containing protein [Corynebacterium poyangense]MBZ8176245.1 hypothetical protein [Corynebacterium poyangense]QNQ89919.1 hypothetical protein GP475_04105 [Corynebacterium poyangense]
MNIIRRHDDGILRIAGIPVGGMSGLTSESRLRSFEPENPHFFIPRRLGVGWDLNLGAVAVRLGMIRPDDSIPDLATYIPQKIYTAAHLTPWLNTCIIHACAWKLSQKPQVISNWGLSGKPRHRTSGNKMALHTLIANSALLFYAFSSPAPGPEKTSSYPELVSSAEVVSLQLALILNALASYRIPPSSARRPVSAAAGLILAPVLSTALCVGIVKSALHHLDRELRNQKNARSHQ